MNKDRKGRVNDVINLLEDAKGELEDILNEEQDAYDSLSDGLQMSSRGEKMQEYIDLTDDCIGKINVVIDKYLCISNITPIFAIISKNKNHGSKRILCINGKG